LNEGERGLLRTAAWAGRWRSFFSLRSFEDAVPLAGAMLPPVLLDDFRAGGGNNPLPEIQALEAPEFSPVRTLHTGRRQWRSWIFKAHGKLQN
jgi:hypothetical protein